MLSVATFVGNSLRTSEPHLRAFDASAVTVSVGDECNFYERETRDGDKVRTTGFECPATWVDHEGERREGVLATNDEGQARAVLDKRVEAHVFDDVAWIEEPDDVARSVRIGKTFNRVGTVAATFFGALLVYLVVAAYRARRSEPDAL